MANAHSIALSKMKQSGGSVAFHALHHGIRSNASGATFAPSRRQFSSSWSSRPPAARRGLLSRTFRIDSTDVRTPFRDDSDGSWNHDPTADEKYFGYGCTLVTTEHNIPVAAAFTDGKQVDEETAMRVTRSPSRNRSG
jgi:hypothetical protein